MYNTSTELSGFDPYSYRLQHGGAGFNDQTRSWNEASGEARTIINNYA
jgi:hypothetical protein